MAAPSPASLAGLKRPVAAQMWAPNPRRLPLTDGGPATPGHWHALRDVAAGRIYRSRDETDGRHRWHWVTWGNRVRIASPRRRYLVDLVLAGHVDQPGETAVLTDTGRALLDELGARWSPTRKVAA